MKSVKILATLDYSGMTASSLCAIHCALLPFLYLLPVIGIGLSKNPWLETVMIGLSILIGTISLSISYFKEHRILKPLIVLIVGFGFIYIGHLNQQILPEALFVVMGGLLIVYAHYINRLFTKHSQTKTIKGYDTCMVNNTNRYEE